MRNLNRLTFASVIVIAEVSSACAGGFQRGQADTDLLYEPGQLSTRVDFGYIIPERGFDTINGVAGDYGTYTGRYRVPSLAVKYGEDSVACAGTYIQPFAAEADYTGSPEGALPAAAGFPFGSRNRKMEFDSHEVAATCRASFETKHERFSLIGGVYVENFDFSASNLATLPSGQSVGTPFGQAPVYLPAEIDVEADSGFSPGFRLGLAYEIPDIALRAQVLYRSQTTHESPGGSASGVLSDSPFIVAPGIGRTSVPSPLPIGSSLPIPDDFRLNDVTSPQSIYLNIQSGITPSTLLTASLRWTDWSTNRELVSQIGDSPVNITPFFWKDGYTVNLGIGHVLTDTISVLASIGFDSGVSTGAETTYTDLYTLSGGLSFKHGFSEVRVGGLLGYWTSDAQSVSHGAQFDATVGNDLVSAVSASLKLAF